MKKLDYKVFIHLFFILFCLVCFVLPFLLVIAISLSDEKSLLMNGYRLIPDKFSFEGYEYVFRNPKKILDAYVITTVQSIIGTFLGVLIMALCAYPLSRPTFRFKKQITFYIFFTMLFGGGLVPVYILNTQYLQLGDKVAIYILPVLANAWFIIIFRTFFQGLPISLIESAKIDGAREFTIFFRIVVPLSKPVFATIALLFLLGRWNDWFTSLLYIRDETLYTLQFLLQRILREAEFVKNIASEVNIGIDLKDFETPTESMRFAMCVVAAGPMLIIFPFFQKYFVKGMTVGSVKG